MTLSIYGNFLDQLISDQREALNIYKTYAVAVAFVGFSVVAFGFYLLIGDMETPKIILTLGGAFIASLSALPIKEINSRKAKIGIFKQFKATIQNINEDGILYHPKQNIAIEEMIMEAIKQTVVAK